MLKKLDNKIIFKVKMKTKIVLNLLKRRKIFSHLRKISHKFDIKGSSIVISIRMLQLIEKGLVLDVSKFKDYICKSNWNHKQKTFFKKLGGTSRVAMRCDIDCFRQLIMV